MNGSLRQCVCASVFPSIRLWHLFHYVLIIVSSRNFQELLPLTEVMSMQKVKVRGQRSNSQRSKPLFRCFWTITPGWILTYGDKMMHKAWCGKLMIFTQIEHFQTLTTVWIYWWLQNDAQSLIYCIRGALFFQSHLSNFKVTADKKLPILTWIGHFGTVTPVWFHRWLGNDVQS